MMNSSRTVVWVMMIFLIISACSSAEEADLIPTTIPTPIPATITPQSTPTQIRIETFEAISYADESPFQVLDVYLPLTGEKPYPTIMGIHGGGFISKSKSAYATLARYYAQEGYAFVSINYRLAPRDTFPAQVEDTFCAFAWINSNQEKYGFDPDNMIVIGESAGGYLASMLATVDDPQEYLVECPYEFPASEPVDAAIVFSGLYDLTNMDEYLGGAEGLEPFLGDEYENVSIDLLEKMSPIKQINGAEPAFLIFHGSDDNTVPVVMSERFSEELIRSGVDVELIIVPGQGHAFQIGSLRGENMDSTLDQIEVFIEKVLEP